MDRNEWGIRQQGPEETGCFAVDVDAVHIPTGRHVTFRLPLYATYSRDERPWDDVLWGAVVAHATRDVS